VDKRQRQNVEGVPQRLEQKVEQLKQFPEWIRKIPEHGQSASQGGMHIRSRVRDCSCAGGQKFDVEYRGPFFSKRHGHGWLRPVEPLAKSNLAAFARRGPAYTVVWTAMQEIRRRGGTGEGILQDGARLHGWHGLGNEWGFELAPLRHGWMAATAFSKGCISGSAMLSPPLHLRPAVQMSHGQCSLQR